MVRPLDTHGPNAFAVVFLQVRLMLSGGAQEFQDNVSGLPTGLNKGLMGWGSTNLRPRSQIQAGR